jgi:hypothetical protein
MVHHRLGRSAVNCPGIPWARALSAVRSCSRCRGSSSSREVRHGRRWCGHCGQPASGLVTSRGALCAACGRRTSQPGLGCGRADGPHMDRTESRELSAGLGLSSTVVHSPLWRTVGYGLAWSPLSKDVLWRNQRLNVHMVIHNQWTTFECPACVAQVSRRSRCAHSCGRTCGCMCGHTLRLWMGL